MHLEQAIAALRFDPLVPPWLLGVLGALCVAALIIPVWRRARGTVWRAASFAVLLLWLAGPLLVQETRETLPDIGLMVVDRSASMQVGERARLTEAARAAIAEQAAHLPDLELRTVSVPEGGSTGTNLFAAMDRALADIPRSRFAGTVMITDGQVHDTPPDGSSSGAASAALGGAPLNVLIPARDEETDRRIRVIEAPPYGLVGKSVWLKVVIEDMGVAHPTGAARLTIRRDGELERVQSAPIGTEQPIEVAITRAGPTVIELSADPLPGEVSTLNNRAVIEINGVRDRLRVLLISGEPHSGERTWRRLLKADPSVDLVHFTILRPPEKDDQTPLNELALIAFPVRELFLDKLDSFDLIVLDRFQNRGLLPTPYLGYIADHVRNGGALLLSVGPEFAGAGSLAATPLGSVLPARPAAIGAALDNAVVDGAFRPRVTALGARHPVTEGLPGANPAPAPDGALNNATPTWGPWYRRIEPTAVRGEVLLDAPDGSPVLVMDRFGKGRAALLLSDQIWLWSRGHQGGGPQAELLRRIAHWLMQEPELEENALTARVADGTLRIERRTTDPAAPEDVTITDPDGKLAHRTLEATAPGRAVTTLPAITPGVWQASDGVRTAYAAAGAANPPELADLRATATRLAPLARASGGGVHWLAASTPGAAPIVPELRRTEPERTASGSAWIGLERRHDHLVTGIASLALLPAWIALPALLGLLLAAWRREGA
jgi:uncharacterized membrane protein